MLHYALQQQAKTPVYIHVARSVGWEVLWLTPLYVVHDSARCRTGSHGKGFHNLTEHEMRPVCSLYNELTGTWPASHGNCGLHSTNTFLVALFMPA